jgi:tRNA (guanine37-N1)-methyltransferase
MKSSPRAFHFISLFPEMISGYFQYGVLNRAQTAGIIVIHNHHLRNFAVDRHGTIDGRPYGGGEGMVLRPDALANAVSAASGDAKPRLILPSPRGSLWTSQIAKNIAEDDRQLMFICPRFSGVDERFIQRFEVEEYSLGDFVISGGELPAILFADSIARFIPGVLGDSDSAVHDSFGDGLQGCLEHPIYTRPESIWGMTVPEVLRSGDHAAIAQWRQQQSRAVTMQRRPDLLKED